jgi:uncharacterized protein YndB with AHSA1/START domain
MKINPELDLVLERIVDIPVELVWKAYTTPELITKWFTPAPWKTTVCTIDLRPGGLFHTIMESPEGESFPSNGCYLEIIPNKKLVWTDALVSDFRPAIIPEATDENKPFNFTAVLLLEAHGAGTKYTAIGMHSNADGRKKHEEMGFHHGWGAALDQLIAHVKNSMMY